MRLGGIEVNMRILAASLFLIGFLVAMAPGMPEGRLYFALVAVGGLLMWLGFMVARHLHSS